jgi:uncharacterized protein (DUF885 family)
MNSKKALYDDFFKELMELYPSINDSLNLKEFDYLNDRYENSYSEYQQQVDTSFFSTYLSKVNKIPTSKMTIHDKCLQHICQSYIEGLNYKLDLIPITPQENEITYLVESAAGGGSYTFSNKSRYDVFLRKMRVFPEICVSIMGKFREGLQENYMLPKIIAIKLREQFEDVLKHKSYHNKKATEQYNREIASIFVPSIKQISAFLLKDYIPKCKKSIGMLHLPNGKKEYAFLVNSSLTLNNVNIEQIHQFGLLEVKRINTMIYSIMDQMDFEGSKPDFFKYMRNRKDLKFKDKAEMLSEYKKMFNKINRDIMPKLFADKIKTPCEILRVPEYNEEYSAEAYYMDGDMRGTRPGRFYLNMRDISQNSKIELESLTLHETIPGHHYQLSLINESKKIPMFVKTLGIESYVEGWGLYCENLGEYKTAESYFGKLVIEMIRALRLVIDTGIHYYGWSYKRCFNFMKKYGFDTDEQIDQQIIRYICMPSQALAYKMGEKCIIECFQKYVKDGGDDIKRFHTMILEDGVVPLFLLREKFGLN